MNTGGVYRQFPPGRFFPDILFSSLLEPDIKMEDSAVLKLHCLARFCHEPTISKPRILEGIRGLEEWTQARVESKDGMVIYPRRQQQAHCAPHHLGHMKSGPERSRDG